MNNEGCFVYTNRFWFLNQLFHGINSFCVHPDSGGLRLTDWLLRDTASFLVHRPINCGLGYLNRKRLSNISFFIGVYDGGFVQLGF